MSHVTCHMSHVTCHMSHVNCLCWSLGHAEQFLFSCSNVAVYGWKVQCLFFDITTTTTTTLACEWTNHRVGSQLKRLTNISCQCINKVMVSMKKYRLTCISWVGMMMEKNNEFSLTLEIWWRYKNRLTNISCQCSVVNSLNHTL